MARRLPSSSRRLYIVSEHAESGRRQDEVGRLERELLSCRSGSEVLQTQITESRSRLRALEERVLDTKGELAQTVARNEKLTYTLREARDSIATLREEVEKLTQAPASYGTFVSHNEDDGTADVFAGGRKVRVSISPEIDEPLEPGQEVVLNDSLNIVMARGRETTGEMASVRELIGLDRAMITGRADEERVVEICEALRGGSLKAGDSVLIDPRAAMIVEKLPRPGVEELVLEEVPDVSYDDIGGLDEQIEQITDAIELPFVHANLFAEFELPSPKGILLYGPPGCGKTLIAKAVANSLANRVAEVTGDTTARSFFINIKGPELLNKYVGETERQIRLVFQRAREKAQEGWPVIVFFDEMESLFRTRGSGISSDIESTIVPQLLAEIDGVETLRNVVVIGASNREDLIDPAILRPGRLDVKIRIERPDELSAASIFSRYLTPNLPVDQNLIDTTGGGDRNKAIAAMVDAAVGEMYRTDKENEFLEVTYRNGDKEVMYFKDFSSGAMIENIVRRAKQLAIKRIIGGGSRGLLAEDLVAATKREFREHEDLPNTTNPDDWAKISGKKGERITYIRTLVGDSKADSSGGREVQRVGTGQYL